MGQRWMGPGAASQTPSLGCSTSQGCHLFSWLFTSNYPKCNICCHDDTSPSLDKSPACRESGCLSPGSPSCHCFLVPEAPQLVLLSPSHWSSKEATIVSYLCDKCSGTSVFFLSLCPGFLLPSLPSFSPSLFPSPWILSLLFLGLPISFSLALPPLSLTLAPAG